MPRAYRGQLVPIFQLCTYVCSDEHSQFWPAMTHDIPTSDLALQMCISQWENRVRHNTGKLSDTLKKDRHLLLVVALSYTCEMANRDMNTTAPLARHLGKTSGSRVDGGRLQPGAPWEVLGGGFLKWEWW